METFSYDFTRVRDQDKSFRIILPDIISEPDSLHPVECRENDIFVLAGVRSLGMAHAGASVQGVYDKVADRFRMITYYIKVF